MKAELTFQFDFFKDQSEQVNKKLIVVEGKRKRLLSNKKE